MRTLLLLLFINSFMAMPAVATNNELIQNTSKQILKLNQNKEKIIGVEFILVNPFDQQIESNWGHSLLRFVDDDNSWTNDIVISFSALTNSDDSSTEQKIKGLIGGYEIIPHTDSLGGFWREYTRKNGRSLKRYPLLLNRESLDQIIEILHKWIQDPTYFGKYFYTSRNCTTLLGALLNKAGVITISDIPAKPTEFPRWLKFNLIAPYHGIEMLNGKSILKKLYDLLNITPKDFSLGRWPKNALEILNASFSTQEKRIIRNEHQFIPRDIKKVLDTQLLGIHKTPLFNAKSLKPEQYRFSFSNKYPKELREQYTKISKTIYSVLVLD